MSWINNNISFESITTNDHHGKRVNFEDKISDVCDYLLHINHPIS